MTFGPPEPVPLLAPVGGGEVRRNEQVAFGIYRGLPAAERRLVDSWRRLGHDFAGALLASGCLADGETVGRLSIESDGTGEIEYARCAGSRETVSVRRGASGSGAAAAAAAEGGVSLWRS